MVLWITIRSWKVFIPIYPGISLSICIQRTQCMLWCSLLRLQRTFCTYDKKVFQYHTTPSFSSINGASMLYTKSGAICHCKILSYQRYCRICLLRGSNALLLMSKAIYHVFAKNDAVTGQKSIFDGIILRILQNISLETCSRICLLSASKAHKVRCDAVCHGFRRDSYSKASVHYYFCGRRYIISAY